MFLPQRPTLTLLILTLLLSPLKASQHRSFNECTEHQRRTQGLFYNKVACSLPTDFPVLPSPTLKVTSTEAYMVAAILGVSLFINTASALQQSSYHCQNDQCKEIQEATPPMLPCQLQPTTAISGKKFIPFPPLMRDFTHPGVYTLNSGYTREEELMTLRTQDYEKAVKTEGFKLIGGSIEEQTAQMLPRWYKLYKSYLFDGHPCGNSCPLDRTYAEKAYDFAENVLIPKSIHKIQCGDLIRLNAFFCGIARSSYRSQAVTIFNTHNNVPMFFKFEKAEEYFKLHAPEDLENYQDLKEEVQQIYGTQIVLENSWRSVINSALLQGPTSHHYHFLKKYYSVNTLTTHEISIQMKSLLKDVKAMSEKSPIEAAATLHMGIVNIHPFADGNGRTARLAANIILVKFGYPAVIYTSEKRYALATHKSINANDPSLFARYLKEEICRTSNLLENPELQGGNSLKNLINNCKISDCMDRFKELASKYNF